MPNAEGGQTTLVQIVKGRFNGPKMKDELVADHCGDIGRVQTDDSIKAEVNLLLRTHDNADIHMHYLASVIPIRSETSDKIEMRSFNFPFFDTAAEHYRWLNHLQALSVNTRLPSDQTDSIRIQSDVYELMP